MYEDFWDIRQTSGQAITIPTDELYALRDLFLSIFYERFKKYAQASSLSDQPRNGIQPNFIRDIRAEGNAYGKLVAECCLWAAANIYELSSLDDLKEDTLAAKRSNLFYLMIMDVWEEIIGIDETRVSSTPEIESIKESIKEGILDHLGPIIDHINRTFGIKKRSFLSLIDLLGFSNEVMSLPLSEVANKLRDFQVLAMDIVEKTNEYRKESGLIKGERSNLIFFSDLLLVYTDNDYHDSCINIVDISCKIFGELIEIGLLPRGAIAWGDIIVGSNVIVGKPLVEAHQLESKQDWAGIALCDSMFTWDCTEGRTEDNASSILAVMKEVNWLVEWDVPIKPCNSEKRLSLNWLSRFSPPHSRDWIDNLEYDPSDTNAKRKIKNTKGFFKHILDITNFTIK